MLRNKILIIGGGVIGLASAFECARRGHRVTVFDKGACGGQASGAAAGMLAPFSEIADDRDDFFKLCFESLKFYRGWQHEVKQQSGIEFEYSESGSLHTVFHEADMLAMETTVDWQRELGVDAQIVESDELRKMEPQLTERAAAAIYYPKEHHLYAPDYVKALEAACRKLGVEIFEHTRVTDVIPRKSCVAVETEHGGRYSGDHLVVCSGAWAKEWEDVFGLAIPVYPIRGQICAFRLPLGTVNRIVFTSQGYFVQKADGSLVCGASEDVAGFDTSVTAEGIARLENWSKFVFPFLQGKSPHHRWAGLRPATRDGFPLLGRLRETPNVIFAVGHYRNGILLSPVTAKTVGALIDDEKAPVCIEMFQSERFS